MKALHRIAAACFASVAVIAAHAAPSFPDRPVRLIVTTAPGTGSDAIARMIETSMGKALGQPVVVENRAGAGGVIGMEYVARAPADGYTIVLGADGTLMASPAMNPENVRYNVERDFAPIAGLFRTAFVIVTANSPEAPRTIAELVERAKQGNLSYGSSGIGTITHLASELFLDRAGIRITHVPYKGAGQSLTDAIAGRVVMVTDTLPAILPMVRAGKLRALAVMSEARIASLPDVPTLHESGYPGLVAQGGWGLLAPAGTPPAVVQALADASLRALQSPDVQARTQALELQPMALEPAAFSSYIKTYTPLWTDLIKKANIRAE